MNALTNFLSERRKPKYNPKILVDFPFNYLYKVNQMKHNLAFNPKKLHRISECEKIDIIIIITIIIIIIMQSTKAKCLNERKKLPSHI